MRPLLVIILILLSTLVHAESYLKHESFLCGSETRKLTPIILIEDAVGLIELSSGQKFTTIKKDVYLSEKSKTNQVWLVKDKDVWKLRVVNEGRTEFEYDCFSASDLVDEIIQKLALNLIPATEKSIHDLQTTNEKLRASVKSLFDENKRLTAELTAAKVALDEVNYNATEAALKEWAGAIHEAIERKKFYPVGASGFGVVEITMTITKSGALSRAIVTKSSGNAIFDKAALAIVQRAKYPPAPTNAIQSIFTFSIPIRIQK